MKEKIRSKMEAHVLSILDKPIITNDEYNLISNYLEKLEIEEDRAANNERLKAAIDIFGAISH